MKMIKVFILAILILGLHSCIPSLHGIVTDENRTTDDRILGSWSYGKTSPSTPIGVNDEQDFELSQRELDYIFEPAVKITYREEGSETYTSLEDVSRSMIPVVDSLITSVEILPYYILTHRELMEGDTIESHFKVEMTQIKENLLLDFVPRPVGRNVFNGRFATNYVLAHTFAKIEFSAGNLLLSPIDAEHIENLISQKRIRLKHERQDGEGIILTASTEELRAFLSNYSDDSELFESADRLYPINR